MLCQGLKGSGGPKSVPNCLMESWLWVDMVEEPGRSGQRTLLRAGECSLPGDVGFLGELLPLDLSLECQP